MSRLPGSLLSRSAAALVWLILCGAGPLAVASTEAGDDPWGPGASQDPWPAIERWQRTGEGSVVDVSLLSGTAGRA